MYTKKNQRTLKIKIFIYTIFILVSFNLFKSSYANEIINYDPMSTYEKKSGRITGNVGVANSEDTIIQAKKICQEIGFTKETDKFDNCTIELMKISDGYEFTRAQEYILAKNAQNNKDVKMTFSYESESGQKVNKDSKWNKFWEAVGWVLYEHGDEILDAAIDAYYGTNNQANASGTRCVSQRVGNSQIIHTNCNGGQRMYCTSQRVGNSKIVHTNCRAR